MNDKVKKDWLKIIPSKKLMFWDYYLNNCSGNSCRGLPVVFPHLISKDLKAVSRFSLGDFIEIYQTQPERKFILGTNHLNVYTTAMLHWDVDLILNEYYSKFYGSAANEMKMFFEFCETNWPKMVKDSNVLKKARGLLLTAKRKTKRSIYTQRIELIENYMNLYKPTK
jgi:hypothetical protein